MYVSSVAYSLIDSAPVQINHISYSDGYESGNPAMARHLVCQWYFTLQPAKHLSRVDGHWAIFSTYPAGITKPVVTKQTGFQESKWSKCVGGRGYAMDPAVAANLKIPQLN